jgi:Fe-S cluster assembly iron-binding protein IscA
MSGRPRFQVTFVAAARVRVAARAAGVDGTPGVRVRAAPSQGTDVFELVIEDRREPGDEVFETRGVRFYVDPQTAIAIERTTLDTADDRGLVFRQRATE